MNTVEYIKIIDQRHASGKINSEKYTRLLNKLMLWSVMFKESCDANELSWEYDEDEMDDDEE